MLLLLPLLYISNAVASQQGNECKVKISHTRLCIAMITRVIKVNKYRQPGLYCSQLKVCKILKDKTSFFLPQHTLTSVQTVGRCRNLVRTRKLLGNVRFLTAQQQFASSTEAVLLFSYFLLGWIVMNKKTIPLSSDV